MSKQARASSLIGMMAVLALVVSGCGRPQAAMVTAVAVASPAVTPIPARDTCPEAVLSQNPAGLTMTDRELVSFSADLVGVETVYADESGTHTIQVMSGGYADEVTETYDNLVEVGNPVVDGSEGALLKGSLLDATVHLLFWQTPGLDAPCDMHVLIGVNVPDDIFDALVPYLKVVRT